MAFTETKGLVTKEIDTEGFKPGRYHRGLEKIYKSITAELNDLPRGKKSIAHLLTGWGVKSGTVSNICRGGEGGFRNRGCSSRGESGIFWCSLGNCCRRSAHNDGRSELGFGSSVAWKKSRSPRGKMLTPISPFLSRGLMAFTVEIPSPTASILHQIISRIFKALSKLVKLNRRASDGE